MTHLSVVGGGIAGLVAAVTAAEAGADVRLLEARRRLGGRAATLPGPFAANLGPHALYAGGSLWAWLRQRGLHRPYRRPALRGIRVRWQGAVQRPDPSLALRILRLPATAPVDRSLRGWAAHHGGPEVARALTGLAGVLTFDPDPGRLSAASVWAKVRRILGHLPPVARYPVGGWGPVVERMAARARTLDVTCETGSRVDDLDDLTVRGPVILALSPGGARRLLADDGLRPVVPRVALLDVGLTARRGDPYLVADLDGAAFVDRFSAVDPTLAPAGHDLVQASVGMAPGEGLAAAERRLEAVFDRAFEGWRDRAVWRRRAALDEAVGAVDLPGRTWRDRTPVAYADGVHLAGDWVAAPGHLAEVSCASALAAVEAALGAPAVAR